ELAEVLDEARVLQEPAALGGRHGGEIEAFGRLLELVQREDVRDGRLLLQADEDVVTEEQVLPDADDVARDAVVLGAHALVADDGGLGAAEELLAPVVEVIGLVAERLGLVEQARADDLVATALQRGLARRGSGGFSCHRQFTGKGYPSCTLS